MNPRWILDLCRAVYLLALDDRSQLKDLEGRGLAPSTDEFGLLFDDAFRLVPQLVNGGALTAQEASVLSTLDERLDQISDWDVSALASTEWEEVRVLARRFLSSPGV